MNVYERSDPTKVIIEEHNERTQSLVIKKLLPQIPLNSYRAYEVLVLFLKIIK